MKRVERRFLLSKNKLDNEHNKYLSYLEITIITIITALISLDIYLFSTNNLTLLKNVSFIGIALIILAIIYFKDRINEIKQQIDKLT